MTFARPEWLLLVAVAALLAPLGAVLARRRMAGALAAYADDRQIEAMLNGARHRAVRRWLLLGGALAALGLALAGPLYGERAVTVQPRGADVVVALDVSLSMAATDIKPNRLARSIHRIEDLMTALAGYRVGLVLFSGSAFPAVPLTLDRGALALSLSAVEAGMIPNPGSSLEAAVTMAAKVFGDPGDGGRALVIVSDGESTAGSVAAAVKRAKRAKMTVYAIGVGGAAGAPIPRYDRNGRMIGYKRDRAGQRVLTRLDPAGLKRLAGATGGIYLESTLAGDEVGQIATAVATLEQTEAEAAERSHLENRYQWPLGLALLLLLLEAALPPFSGRKKPVTE